METKCKLPTDYELLQIAKQFQNEHECTIGTAFIRGAKYIINLLNEQGNGEE